MLASKTNSEMLRDRVAVASSVTTGTTPVNILMVSTRPELNTVMM